VKSALRHLAALRRLPPGVARFYLRAVLTALRKRDKETLRDVTRPAELSILLERARGRLDVVELGTGPAWTAAALALADRKRRVVTYDPKVYRCREAYLSRLPPEVRARIELRRARGEDEQPSGTSADFVFIDSRHERDPTLATFRTWAPLVRRGGIVAFHDYGNPRWPGVAEAVDELALQGDRLPFLFFWEKP
jgi:predicted O-methyltransferase YrrM